MHRPSFALVRFAFLLTIAVVTAPLALAQANVSGQWSTLTNATMPINPVHVALMHNGKALVVSGSGNDPSVPAQNWAAGVWDPQTGNTTTQIVSWDMFCNGMVVLPDGRPFINGGTQQYDPFHGALTSAIYDPATNAFTNVQNMAHGRWYPTVTTLGDGRVMTFSGLNETGGTNSTVEFYTAGSGWSAAFAAGWTPPLYPRMHLLPNGKVFYTGASTQSRYFDPSAHTWTNGPVSNFGSRPYGSSVLLKLSPSNSYAAKVMILGGGSPSTNSTEIVDLSAPSPAWVSGPPMSQPRIEMNAVILPNGQVLALGGSLNDEDTNTASLKADLYNPATNGFIAAGSEAYSRLYHSVALLLPDATVWVAGGNPVRGTYVPQMEIYKPPYLFKADGSAATRPTIGAAPASVAYGNNFPLQTADAPNISSVVLMRPGSPTHAFDQDQRAVEMSFTLADPNTLTVTAPPNGNIAPPGYYMLFLLNSAGVPSVANFIQLAPQPDFSLLVLPASANVNPSSGVNYTVTVTSIAGFSGNVSLSASGLPANATASFSPATVSGSGASTLTITAGASTPVGTYPLTITGTSGTLTHTANASLSVTTTTGTGALAYVQGNYATPQSSPSSVPVTYTAGQVAGDLNVVVAGWNDSTAQVSSVTDTSGNIYKLAVGPTTLSGSLSQSIYYASNIVAAAGNANVVTVSFNKAAAFPDIRIAEYSGVDPVNPVDVKVAATGTSQSSSSGNVVTTNAADLLFAANIVTTLTVGPGPSFNNRMITVPDGDIVEDQIVSTTGTYSATAPMNSSGGWIMQLVAFRAASGPPIAAAPTFSPAPGTYTSAQPVTISDATAGATIHYTTDLSDPTTSSPVYTAQINVSSNVTIKAMAEAAGYTNSPVATGAYTIQLPTTATPAFAPAGGTYNTAQSVTLSDATTGATIYYTTDGTTPTIPPGGTTTQYTQTAIPVTTTGTTIKAIASASGNLDSAVASATYTLVAATPTFSPAPGTYTSSQSVQILESTPGTTVYYTTDGTNPTTSSAVYNAAIPVSTTTTIKAMAVATGFGNSTVTSGLYTIQLPTTATPAISPAGGTYNTTQSVTLSDTTAGATIYYTTDGTTPTIPPGGTTTQYTQTAIPVTTTGTTIKAIASASGNLNSAVASATYTLVAATPTFSPAPGSYATAQSVTLGDATPGTTIYYTTDGSNPTTSSAVYNNIPIAVNATTTIKAMAVAAGFGNSTVASGTYNIGVTIPIAFAQVAAAAPQTTNQTTVSVSFPGAQTAGDLNIVVVGWNDTTAKVSSVVDSRGNTYVLALGPTLGTLLSQSIYYASGVAAGSNTVTVTFTQAAAYPDIRILEYKGVTTLDAKAAAKGSGNSANSGAATTTTANELIFGANMVQGSTKSAGAGFTARIITVPDSDIAEDRIVTATGSYSATSTLNANKPWIMQMVTFKK